MVGILGSASLGLKETGYVEGQNVAIESRWGKAISSVCPSWQRNARTPKMLD